MPRQGLLHWLRRNKQEPREKGAKRLRFSKFWRRIPWLERLEERIVPATVNEVEPNDVLALATAMSLTQDPGTSHFYTGLGLGSLGTTSDADYWSFTAQTGDRISVAGDGGLNANSAYIELRNASDTILTQAGDYNGGHAQITNFLIPTDGTYYVKVHTYYSGYTLSTYSLRVDESRGFLAEAESNDSTGSASAITLSPGDAGHATGQVSGNITTSTDTDYFNLGNLRSGDTVDLSAALPSVSTLDPHIRLIRAEGGGVLAESSGSSHTTFTLTADDTYYAQVTANTASTAGNQALYLLTADIADATAPTVVGTNLPALYSPGRALSFDGVNDYVRVPDAASLQPASGITLEGWFNFSAVGGLRHLITKTAGTGTADSFALWHDGSHLLGSIGNTSGNPNQLSYTWTPQLGDLVPHCVYLRRCHQFPDPVHRREYCRLQHHDGVDGLR
jgi:hypothetical protein